MTTPTASTSLRWETWAPTTSTDVMGGTISYRYAGHLINNMGENLPEGPSWGPGVPGAPAFRGQFGFGRGDVTNSLEWLLQHDADKYVGPMTRQEKEEYLGRASIAMNDIEALEMVEGNQVERILYWLSLALGWCWSRDPTTPEVEIRAIDSIPSLFSWLAASGPHRGDGPVFMFWDGVIPRRKLGQGLRDAMFAALAHQLFLDDDTVKAGAGHGFNHLKDRRCLPLLDHVIRTTDNGELAEYLRAAMTFELM